MRTTHLLACLLITALLLPLSALAYERPDALSLNGEWEFAPCEPLSEIDAGAAVPWDAEWTPVKVPQAWETYTHPGYSEAGWYARFVDIPMEWVASSSGGVSPPDDDGRRDAAPTASRIWLELDAVATSTGVWLDGEFIAAQVGDSTRWRVELTDLVQRKVERARQSGGEGYDAVSPYTLLIAVYVHELPGIWQAVRIYSTGAVSIAPDGFELSYEMLEGLEQFNCEYTCTVLLEGLELAELSSLHFNVEMVFSQPNPVGGCFKSEYYMPASDCEVTAVAGGTELAFKGVEWFEPGSPDNPVRYDINLKLMQDDPAGGDRLVLDSVTETFTFGEFEID